MMSGYCHSCGYGVRTCECPGGAKVVFYWSDRALAAAARQGGDVQQAPAESPQSGPKGNAQKVQP